MIKTWRPQERKGHEHGVCSWRPSQTHLRERLEVTARDALFEEDSEVGSMSPSPWIWCGSDAGILGLGPKRSCFFCLDRWNPCSWSPESSGKTSDCSEVAVPPGMAHRYSGPQSQLGPAFEPSQPRHQT